MGPALLVLVGAHGLGVNAPLTLLAPERWGLVSLFP